MNKTQKATSQQPITTTQLCEVIKKKEHHKEIKKVLLYYKRHHNTTLGAARDLGIERANVCWYVKDLMDMGFIQVIYRAPDYKTGFFAKFYSANPAEWKENYKQLNLFGEE